MLTIIQRCHGRVRTQALLLPTHDYDSRRSDREAPEVCTGPKIFDQMHIELTRHDRYTPDGRNEKKQRLNETE